MPDVNGMSSFNSQPIESSNLDIRSNSYYHPDMTSGFYDGHKEYGDKGITDSDIDSIYDRDLLSYNQWINSDEMNLEYFGRILSPTERSDLTKGDPFTSLGNYITGFGPKSSKGYSDYKDKYQFRNSTRQEYAQLAKMGISPYAVLDNTSVSATGASLNQRKPDDNSSQMIRLFGILMLALARIAA